MPEYTSPKICTIASRLLKMPLSRMGQFGKDIKAVAASALTQARNKPTPRKAPKMRSVILTLLLLCAPHAVVAQQLPCPAITYGSQDSLLVNTAEWIGTTASLPAGIYQCSITVGGVTQQVPKPLNFTNCAWKTAYVLHLIQPHQVINGLISVDISFTNLGTGQVIQSAPGGALTVLPSDNAPRSHALLGDPYCEDHVANELKWIEAEFEACKREWCDEGPPSVQCQLCYFYHEVRLDDLALWYACCIGIIHCM